MATPPDFVSGQILTAAQMNAVGLWQLGTFTLTSTSTNINSIFSSDFTNYRLVLSGLAVSSNDNITFRYRTVSAASSAAIYDEFFVQLNYAGTLTGVASPNRTAHRTGFYDSTKANSGAVIDIYGPNTTSETTATFSSMQNNVQSWAGGYVHRSASSFTGVEFVSAVTMSGTVSVYGYRKS